VNVGNQSEGVAFSPDGKEVYVTNLDSGNISIVNTTTNTVTARIKVEGWAWGIAFSPNGKIVYATNCGYNGSVFVIDTTTNKVTANVKVGT